MRGGTVKNGKNRLIVRGLLALIVVGLALGGWKVFQWQSRLVDVGGVRIDPLAEIHPNRRYEVVLWEPDLFIPGGGTNPQREAVLEAVRELSHIYPNISVEVVFIDPAELPSRLQEALDAGMPPDIAGTMLGHRFDTPLQIPVTPFLSEVNRADLAAPAVAGVTIGDTMWAWPRWITMDLWLHHASIDGFTMASGALDDDTFLERARAVQPNRHVLAYNAYDPRLFAGMITATTGHGLYDETGTLQWTEEAMLQAAHFLHSLQQEKLMSAQPEQVSRSRLENFWERQAAAVAPVNHLLLHHAFTRVGELTHPEESDAAAGHSSSVLAVTSPPYFGDHLVGVSGYVAGYAVFRREPHVGDDHTRAVMLVADHLSRRLGLWQASRLLAIPAHPSSLSKWAVGTGLPAVHTNALVALAERLTAPPADHHIARLEAEALEKVIAPKLFDLLAGRLDPRAFVEAVRRELEAIAAARLGTLRAIQP